MSKLLRIVDNTAASTSEIGNVCRISALLSDLAIEASSARSKEFLNRIDAAIAEAETVSGLNEIEAANAQACRPAEPQELKRQLQILIGAFPNAAKQDLSIFGVALIEDVAAERPSIGVLTNACRKLRRSNTFLPTISEVLEALSQETRRQQGQVAAIREFAQRLDVAKAAAAAARERISRDFDRLLAICLGLLDNFENTNWIPPEVLQEANRRRSAGAIDDASAASMRQRLDALPGLQRMPHKDSGWSQ
jgi:hypothetical protein